MTVPVVSPPKTPDSSTKSVKGIWQEMDDDEDSFDGMDNDGDDDEEAIRKLRHRSVSQVSSIVDRISSISVSRPKSPAGLSPTNVHSMQLTKQKLFSGQWERVSSANTTSAPTQPALAATLPTIRVVHVLTLSSTMMRLEEWMAEYKTVDTTLDLDGWATDTKVGSYALLCCLV